METGGKYLNAMHKRKKTRKKIFEGTARTKREKGEKLAKWRIREKNTLIRKRRRRFNHLYEIRKRNFCSLIFCFLCFVARRPAANRRFNPKQCLYSVSVDENGLLRKIESKIWEKKSFIQRVIVFEIIELEYAPSASDKSSNVEFFILHSRFSFSFKNIYIYFLYRAPINTSTLNSELSITLQNLLATKKYLFRNSYYADLETNRELLR